MAYILSPSILSADFANLAGEVALVKENGAKWLHIDVMDGAFVPNLTIGVPVVKSLRKATDLFLDVHLMVEEPARFIKDFVSAGADLLCVHAEACRHLDRTITEIRACGAKVGVALNPATELTVLDYILPNVDMVLLMSVNPGFAGQSFIPYTVDKLKQLAAIREERGLSFMIEVDGGITTENAGAVLEAGADILVAGSAVFSGDVGENVRQFLRIMEA